jgi:hypothetical protein
MRRVVSLIVLAGALSGCGATLFSGQDLKVHATGDTLYIFARSDGVSRNLCANLGSDVAFSEGRWASDEGRSIRTGRLVGCYTVRHVIVCEEGNAACLAHEERHKREGNFHR